MPGYFVAFYLYWPIAVSGKWKHVTAGAGDSTADHRFTGRKSTDHYTEEGKPDGHEMLDDLPEEQLKSKEK